MARDLLDGVGVKVTKLNNWTKWSRLSAVASSNLARLTVAAPFVGFLILLNQPLQGFLQLEPSGSGVPIIGPMAERRFEIFYLGLILIGAGVGIFPIAGPNRVIKNKSIREYLEFKENTKTDLSVSGSLQKSIDAFTQSATAEQRNWMFVEETAEFPEKWRDSFFACCSTTSKIC